MKKTIHSYSKAAVIFATLFCLLLSATKTNAQASIPNWTALGGISDTIFGINTSFINNHHLANTCLTSDLKGNLYAASGVEHINVNGAVVKTTDGFVAKWNGSVWNVLSGLKDSAVINSLTTDTKGNLYAAGYIINDSGRNFVAFWNDTTWNELGGTNTSTFDKTINVVKADVNGNVYAAGNLTNDSGKYYVAIWNGKEWSELGGTNTSTFNGTISSLIIDAKGNIYAAGSFTNDSGKNYVALWNGKAWSELGGANTSTFNGTIFSIAIDAKENLYAGGAFNDSMSNAYVALWNGKAWSELARLGITNLGSNSVIDYSLINKIETSFQGDVYASCTYFGSESSVWYWLVKWNGMGWDTLSTGFLFQIPSCFTIDTHNNLYMQTISGPVYEYIPTLPVTIASLNATKKDKIVALDWQTATEINTSNFNIQHSIDGTSFTTIGTVKATGSGANRYSFIDIHPNNGTNYYRLVSVDKDGMATYSRVVSCEWLVVSKQLALYPNPAHGNVTINGNHIASIQVQDNIGRVVKTVSLKDATNPTLNVGSLQAGVYHLRVQTTDGKVSGGNLVVSDK